ncbi:hypothetical protein [Microbacterium sp. T2.11-28]|uniref:hypothetical protein n=1 Tax=Microbacterium sp. T2.11-28 TaxID=3041169 RepID=UPI0025411660|nr:hypothetical protein [Microbacterium sp. T2.11-28]
MPKVRSPFVSASVPYLTDRVPAGAVRYLPTGPDAPLTAARVNDFIANTADKPDVRLAVLGVLRAHSMNGAEAPAAIFAVVIAALTVLVGTTLSASGIGEFLGWVTSGGLVILGGWFARLAFAAQARRIICGVWLAAYEDALR